MKEKLMIIKPGSGPITYNELALDTKQYNLCWLWDYFYNKQSYWKPSCKLGLVKNKSSSYKLQVYVVCTNPTKNPHANYYLMKKKKQMDN